MTEPGNKSLKDEAAVTLNMTRAVRYPSLMLQTGALCFKHNMT